METVKALNCESPEQYFEMLRACGALKTLIQEDSLNIGSLAEIKKKTENSEIRWAVLLKDTKEIKEVNNKFNVPKSYAQLSEVFRHFALFMSEVDFNPEKILGLLQATDAFRRPERFMTACSTFNMIGDLKEKIDWDVLLSQLNTLRPSKKLKEGQEIAQNLKEKRLETINKFIK